MIKQNIKNSDAHSVSIKGSEEDVTSTGSSAGDDGQSEPLEINRRNRIRIRGIDQKAASNQDEASSPTSDKRTS